MSETGVSSLCACETLIMSALICLQISVQNISWIEQRDKVCSEEVIQKRCPGLTADLGGRALQ